MESCSMGFAMSATLDDGIDIQSGRADWTRGVAADSPEGNRPRQIESRRRNEAKQNERSAETSVDVEQKKTPNDNNRQREQDRRFGDLLVFFLFGRLFSASIASSSSSSSSSRSFCSPETKTKERGDSVRRFLAVPLRFARTQTSSPSTRFVFLSHSSKPSFISLFSGLSKKIQSNPG